MGKVYRAVDTCLNHRVAIKISSDQFSERFEREARHFSGRVENFLQQAFPTSRAYGLELRSALPVSKSTGHETCSWIASHFPLIFL